jgi:hypothetical protein
MHTGMALDIAKERSVDALFGAQHGRPPRQLSEAESSGAIEAVGWRARIGRLLGGLPVLHSRRPRAAGG